MDYRVKTTEQLVDGEKTNYSGRCEMSAPATWNSPKEGPQRPTNACKVREMGETEERNIIW